MNNLNTEEKVMRLAAQKIIGRKVSSCCARGHSLDDVMLDGGAGGSCWCYDCCEMAEADAVQAPISLDPLAVLRIIARLEAALKTIGKYRRGK